MCVISAGGARQKAWDDFNFPFLMDLSWYFSRFPEMGAPLIYLQKSVIWDPSVLVGASWVRAFLTIINVEN